MKKKTNQGIAFDKHSIYGHIAAGAVMVCTYNSNPFYLETRTTKKKVHINKGDRLLVSPVEDKVMVYGKFGNFRDEDGVYHAGKIELSPKEILVGESVVLYSEEAISRVQFGWYNVGISDEEAKKIRDLDPESVDTKKKYEHFDGKEIKENLKAAGRNVIKKGVSFLKDIWKD